MVSTSLRAAADMLMPLVITFRARGILPRIARGSEVDDQLIVGGRANLCLAGADEALGNAR